MTASKDFEPLTNFSVIMVMVVRMEVKFGGFSRKCHCERYRASFFSSQEVLAGV